MANLAEYASAQKKTQRLNRGYWRWKDTLANVTIDGTTMISSRALQRILKVHGGGAAQYSRIELERAPGLDIDVAGPAATQTLRSVGASKASQNDVRSSLVHFFRD
jgi:hypothetical protein